MNRKILSIVLILVGLILILSPYIINTVIKYTSSPSLIEEFSAEDLQSNNKREAEFDFSSVKDVEIASSLVLSTKIDKNLIIGQIVIPGINLNLPIVKGLSDSNLLAGAATMKEKQSMGSGNFSLAGHNMKQNNTLFGNLMNIKEGSVVKITDKNTVYEYKIYETIIVPDDTVQIIEDNIAEEHGKPVISLMTCYHTSKSGKRFFAMGELIKQYPYDENFTTEN